MVQSCRIPQYDVTWQFCEIIQVVTIFNGILGLDLNLSTSRCNHAMLCDQGIYRDKTMAYKLMYIPNDNIQNYPLCKIELVVETFFEH